jgi:hypothetical protein
MNDHVPGPWDDVEKNEPTSADKVAAAADQWALLVEGMSGSKAQLVAAGFTPEHAEQVVVESMIAGLVDNQAAARITAANAEVHATQARFPFFRRP